MSDAQQRLFLILAPQQPMLEALKGQLADPRIASALVAPSTGAPPPDAKILQSMLAGLQNHNIAVLLEDPELAAATGADGVHAAIGANHDMSALDAAIRAMKPHGITGAGNVHNRHDAMVAGEKNIDYILFGEPGIHGKIPPVSETAERATWWSEVFTIPCVAHAANQAAFAEIAATGADFVSIYLEDGGDPSQSISYLDYALSNLQSVT